jgi:hypothetical protein
MIEYTEITPNPDMERYIESRVEAAVVAYIEQAIDENKPFPPITIAIVRYRVSGYIQITLESDSGWLAVYQWDFIANRPVLVEWANHRENGSLYKVAANIKLMVIREVF